MRHVNCVRNPELQVSENDSYWLNWEKKINFAINLQKLILKCY